ncbi:hypothetical protein [Sorangium sp. So ce131]|uniref:hypothetical protein n=1 Tax=Sorangium sp. So ce131 TaxID=3133282 RepID=UPI003F61395B
MSARRPRARAFTWRALGRLALIVLAATAPATEALAQGGPARRPRAVVLVAPSAAHLGVELRQALEVQAASVGVDVVAEPTTGAGGSLEDGLARDRAAASAHQAFAAVRVVGDADGAVLLVVTDVGRARSIVRRVDAGAGASTVVEETSVIVASHLAALLEGGEIGVSPPAQARAPAAPPREERAPWLRLMIGYDGTSLSPEVPWWSGVRLGISARLGHHLYVGAASVLSADTTIRTEHAALTLRRHPIELAAGYTAGGPALAWLAEAGGLLDVLVATRVEAAPGFRAASPADRWEAGLTARTGAAWQPAGTALSLAALAGADYLVARARYVVNAPGAERVTEAAPWRGRAELRLSVPLW